MSVQRQKPASRRSEDNSCKVGLLLSTLLCSVLALLFLILSGHSAGQIGQFALAENSWEGARRMRRQTLPADNVRVYATNSNVSVADKVQVLSAESRIQLLETHLNATIWSNGSLLQMSPNGQEVALSASQAISLTMALAGGARVEGVGDSLQLNESSRAKPASSASSSEWYSRLEAELAGPRVNLTWLDAQGALALRAMEARLAALVSLGWERPGQEEELRVLSALAQTGEGPERELSIVAESAAYQVQMRLVGAQTSLQFRGARLDIPPAHRSLTLRWQGWLVQVQSLESPFEVHVTRRELRVNCFDEGLTLRVAADSIGLEVGRLSRLMVNRSSSTSASPSSLRVNGGQVGSSTNGAPQTDLAELVSRQLQLSLSRDAQLGQAVLADARHSQLKLAHANRTSATLTAIRHVVEMLGGQPSLELIAGNVSVQMSAGGGGGEPTGQLETDILPPELLATEGEDIFGIGPIALSAWPSTSSPPPGPSSSPAPRPSSSPSSSLPPIVRPAPTSSSPPPPPPVPTPLMARPDQLFTFRQSLPPVPPPSSPVPAASPSSQLDAFPSPQAQLFTFPPADADFLVGQFETAAALIGQPHWTAATERIPIWATISSLQVPEEEGEGGDRAAQDFPGIQRENRRLIWRPEEVLEKSEEGEGGGEAGKSTTEPRRTRQISLGGEEGEQQQQIILDMRLGPEEDLRERRLRDELGRGMEQMLNGEGEEDGKPRRARAGHFRVSRVWLEPVEGGGEGAVRVHFLVDGGGGGGEEMESLEKLVQERGMARGVEMAGHQLLAPVRLSPSPSSATNFSSSSSSSANANFTSISARSSALLAIWAYSMPVLPLGLLALGLSILAMLAGLRPSAKAVQKVGQWMRKGRLGRIAEDRGEMPA